MFYLGTYLWHFFFVCHKYVKSFNTFVKLVYNNCNVFVIAVYFCNTQYYYVLCQSICLIFLIVVSIFHPSSKTELADVLDRHITIQLLYALLFAENQGNNIYPTLGKLMIILNYLSKVGRKHFKKL